jgi:hypothetical protein
MGNPETKATLGYDIVGRQAYEKKIWNKNGKLKDVFNHSINYEINKIKNARKANLDTNILF